LLFLLRDSPGRVALAQGTTRLMLTKIPFFRDIVISSFSCPHCDYENTGVQQAGMIQERGARYELVVRQKPVRCSRGLSALVRPGVGISF
jgi:C4-type Zn-finger protein